MSKLRALWEELGMLGAGAIALIGATVLFALTAVKPLEDQRTSIAAELEMRRSPHSDDGWKRVSIPAKVDQLDLFYRFFQRQESLDEWLAKLYGAASAAGVELKGGDYRLDITRQRIARYQITFPVVGTYGELRTFIDTALAGLPVLSLDQVSFRRKGPNEARIEAEMSFSLYLAPQ